MADIVARREARRKRILENSESRLRKITSIHQDLVEDDSPKHNLNSQKSSLLLTNCYPVQTDFNDSDKEIESYDASYTKENIDVEERADIVTEPTVHNSETWIISLIALFVSIANIVCVNLEHTRNILGLEPKYINKIFIPFLLYKLINFVIIKSTVKENVFLNTLLLFSNIPPRYTRKIVIFSSVSLIVLQDMFLYFFVFITFELLISMFTLY